MHPIPYSKFFVRATICLNHIHFKSLSVRGRKIKVSFTFTTMMKGRISHNNTQIERAIQNKKES